MNRVERMTVISIVEDEPFIVEALCYLFELEGWQVSVIPDGAIACDELVSAKPSLVLLDYMLPNKSGITVAKEFRATDFGKDVPILMLTAKGQNKDRQMAQLSGINHFMTKPFANAELVATVKELLEQSQTADT